MALVTHIDRKSLTEIPARRKFLNKIFGSVCLVATMIGVVMLAVLLYQVFADGSSYLQPKLFQNFASRRPSAAGIKAAIVGSVYIMGLTALISVPIGVAAAIYLEEFVRRKTRLIQWIEINISNLAGVPSIVYGILGLTVFVRWLALDRSIISGALTMSLLILPMLISVTQEALKAVPPSFREASFGLGATDWQTIRFQVLPNAASGIFTGIILALSRAIGETAPLIMIGAVSYIAFLPNGLSDSFTVLPIQIYNWIQLPKEEFHKLAAAAIIVLLAVLLLLNSIAIYLRIRTSKK